MLNYSDITADQMTAIDYLFEHDVTYLVATMGFGKSVVALTAIDELLGAAVLKRVLIVAPLRAAQDVWTREHDNWLHLSGMRVDVAIGTAKQRKAAIEGDASVVVINLENFVWFLNEYPDLAGFDGLLLDELSKFKDSSTKLAKKLRHKVKGFSWVCGMTGTPVNEDFTGLFSQLLCLDGGATYGKNKEVFLKKYFTATDWEQRNWELRAGQLGPLLDKLKGCLHVAPDYTHTLPPVHEVTVGFDLPADVMTEYRKFARDSVMEVDGVEIVAENAAVLSGKMEQYASGFIYLDEESWFPMHNVRAFEFGKWLAKVPSAVICYWYQAELTAIKDFLDRIGAVYLHASDAGAIDAWNNGDIDYLLMHPQSAGHGLNLAKGGCDMVFYTPIWSNDIFKQCIARLWRRGQTETVTAYIFAASKTIDMLKISRVEDKSEYMELFLEHVAQCKESV